MVVESFGVWAPSSMRTLKTIASRATTYSGLPTHRAMANLLRQLSVVLWAFNARILRAQLDLQDDVPRLGPSCLSFIFPLLFFLFSLFVSGCLLECLWDFVSSFLGCCFFLSSSLHFFLFFFLYANTDLPKTRNVKQKTIQRTE